MTLIFKTIKIKIKQLNLNQVKIVDAAKIAIKNRIKDKETMTDFI